VLRENRPGIAYPLMRGVRAARFPLIATLDADCIPVRGWAEAMVSALKSADLAVGETLSVPGQTVWEKASYEIFHQHSRRAALASSAPLPWGPACNLGFHRKWVKMSGGFDPAAAGAFDVDFCWRAVLSGARLVWAPRARVLHRRRSTAEALERQFYRYGAALPWLTRRYQKILELDEETPLDLAVNAGRRVLGLSHRSHRSEVAVAALAYACGAWVAKRGATPLDPEKYPRPGWWIDSAGRRASIVAGRGIVRYSRR
ncbi:MAG: glycosyltransferase, partial [Bdellovibrionales bacterium]|nr:glycosyltransferase [Bdellovibrionales bacterium]